MRYKESIDNAELMIRIREQGGLRTYVLPRDRFMKWWRRTWSRNHALLEKLTKWREK